MPLLLGRHHQKFIVFCECLDDSVRLLYLGYLPSSPTLPRTAFSIRMLQLHHHLWKTSALSTSSFIEGMSAFLDTRCHSRLHSRSGSHKDRNLCSPFSQTIDLYRGILQQQDKLYRDDLSLTAPQLWADECPRCFGPPDGEVKVTPEEPHTIVAMDGNFQHRHNSYASKDSPKDEDYPASFLPPSQINSAQRVFSLTDAKGKDIKVKSHCLFFVLCILKQSTDPFRCQIFLRLLVPTRTLLQTMFGSRPPGTDVMTRVYLRALVATMCL